MIPNHDKPLGPEHCVMCFLYHSNPVYKALVDGHPVPSKVPCRHRGERLSGRVMASLSLDLRREWYLCALGLGDPKGAVCECKGCGPKCESYSGSD